MRTAYLTCFHQREPHERVRFVREKNLTCPPQVLHSLEHGKGRGRQGRLPGGRTEAIHRPQLFAWLYVMALLRESIR